MKGDKKKTYQYLLEHFGEKKIRDRTALLIETAKHLIKSYEISEYVSINFGLIEQIIIDYFADVKRLKDFHHIEKIDFPKISAYTTYWAIRRKPLQIKTAVPDEVTRKKQILIDINEWFASYLLKCMVFDMAKPIFKDLANWIRFDNLLTYFLTYRIVTPLGLIRESPVRDKKGRRLFTLATKKRSLGEVKC